MSTDDLKRALLTVADTDRPAADPDADLARARTAARARSGRRFRAALGGITAAVVLAVGAGVVLDEPAAPDPDPDLDGVVLVDQRFEATPYTFDLTPEGWSVQAQQPTAVTIVPDDGSTSDDPNDFRGKLVILFDTNPPAGPGLERDGRRYWVSKSPGYYTVATRSRAGEPEGVVRIQYPSGTGWDLDAMIEFLASVHVGSGARHGLG